MERSLKSFFGSLLHWVVTRPLGIPSWQNPGDEPLLRSELFNADQMARHGELLAGLHELTTARAADQLLTRLSENEDVLTQVCNLLTGAVKANLQITPASEWLLDNFYLIEEHIHIAKRHFPKSYSRGLPCLSNGASAGLPRVYDIALEIISHGDGRVDVEGLSRFLTAYQAATILTLGELWAVPIMLRLALIENLRRIGARIAAARIDRDLAISWAVRMIAVAEKDPKSLVLVTAEMAASDPPISGAFIAEFARRLQGQSPALVLPLNWIEQLLAESGLTIEQLVRSENQQQAVEQVSISNSITSLRLLEAMDWREFVESMSSVEAILRQDVGGVYAKMDFASRDRYRGSVERMAKSSGMPEKEVAAKAIRLARECADAYGDTDRGAHVGFYLIDAGARRLETEISARLSVGLMLRRLSTRAPLLFYAGWIILLTAGMTATLLLAAYAYGLHGWPLVPVGLALFLSTSYLAVAVVNWLATLLALPQLLPRMDFSKGIPAELRSLVVVPSMLTSAKKIEELVEALEVRFLGNRDTHLYFCLLTDFQDAAAESMPDDAQLLQLARQQIEELNRKYPRPSGDAFFLFHRARRWNPGERLWMGYERKRGKISDLNAFLRDGSTARFSSVVGDVSALSNVKYVITLDTDTQLPRDSARQFVGVMAHPLNRARYDAGRDRVSEGYGVVQPRVAISLTSVNRTRYSRMLAGKPGIDPYTRAVSDVYQDLFAEASFIGKGIYDVDAFESSLNGRFPENLILSHDLLEGSHARTGLLSDVLLYEDHPAEYSSDAARKHRWTRGDWQIALWLLPRVPGSDGERRKNPLSAFSRCKILDNLRRSLVPVALTGLLLLAWTLLAWSWLWTVCVIAILLTPMLLTSFHDLFGKPRDALLGPHILDALDSARRDAAQVLFMLACLPFEAWLNLDAILRALVRMTITRTHLLEWTPAGSQERAGGNDVASYLRLMWAAPVIAVIALAGLIYWRPEVLFAAAPILALWFMSPLFAWWLSQPLAGREPGLAPEQRLFLRRLSRKIWAFFETFVGPEDHWLPPDSYQEYPSPITAHRTSPTNMGMALLANLAAYDFGYIPAAQFIERTVNAFTSMQSLERYRGHFYNWYDIQSMQPLQPLYISSVDSGNLAGHLLTLRQGLLALPDEPVLSREFLDGLEDTLGVLASIPGAETVAGLDAFQGELRLARDTPPMSLAAAKSCLERLTSAALAMSPDAEPGSEESGWWLQALARQCRQALDDLAPLCTAPDGAPDDAGRIPTLSELAKRGVPAAVERIAHLHELAARAGQLADMDYDFLYDEGRRLLAIGYNPTERRRDPNYYDLLASEVRLCSFVMIAQGKLPQEHWFALGRLLTVSGHTPILMSWSGSMFEYLMPLLVMPTFEDTLLDQAYRIAVQRQIDYGTAHQVPWGISESGYNLLSAHFNYQYQAFGVPGLGLKRGLTDDLVIAPYATALALMVAPEAACLNLQRMAAEGFEGRYGLYEAIDYTPGRVPRGQSHAVVRSFMAHHQGMSLLSLAYLLLDRPMQKRFESDQSFQATTLLLQERVPKITHSYSHSAELADLHAAHSDVESPIRVLNNPNTPIPEIQLLSNGRYHVMTSNAGAGYSKWKDIAITRWREDGTRDHWGAFCYLKDVASGVVWSSTHQPTLKSVDKYEAILAQGRTEYRNSREDIETHTTIAVSPEDDIELRRVNITNHSRVQRLVELTSYAEVVLAPAAADDSHPAFSNLFVETEILRERQAILCTRRSRSSDEHPPCMFHLVAANVPTVQAVSYETDRMRFVGRGNTPADPAAMRSKSPLSGSQGSVLDPIVAIRYRVALEPGETASINMVTGIAETRDACLGLVEKYQDSRLANRVFDLAYIHSQVILRQLNATEADAQLYGRIASSVIYANSALRAQPGVIIRNRRGQSGLWGYSISGDLPIVLLRIGDPANIDMVRQLVKAHAYWRLKGLAVDLVIWNEDHAGYRQGLHDQIIGLISTGTETNVIDNSGGIFVKLAEQISEEDRTLLQTVARVIIADSAGSLPSQVNRRPTTDNKMPLLTPARSARAVTVTAPESSPRDPPFANGLGGFAADGREYVISLAPGQMTPAPWVNVLANPGFGTLVSESGVASTWSENSHEFRLTPWFNDAVSDPAGEAFYIRDEGSGHFWSPSALPARGTGAYRIRHGFGYSVFEHTEDGIDSELCIYVAKDAAVKFAVLKLRNRSGRVRKLSVTGYLEWVLGDLRSKSMMHVTTEIDADSGALLARNPYSPDFPRQVAFFDVDDTERSYTGDRSEFLGRNGSATEPAALKRTRLSGKVGAGLDPCGALQVSMDLAEGREREIVFRIGVGKNDEEARELVRRFRGIEAAHAALGAVREYWQHTLGAVQVETPDKSLDVLANGWLLYQTLACRLWARTAFYQPSGAFGFRDQLQDVMALIHAEPALTRAQLLLCASRQFPEGDVQHWWQTPSGRGIRSLCSDDYLWLPLVAYRYVLGTGDSGVLDEPVRFIQGRALNPGEDSYYDLPRQSANTASLYEHCTLAILRALRFGEHGLPFMGTGDWNDGMNKVGEQGKGESVWLGFFLHRVLTQFGEVAQLRGDAVLVERCRDEADRLRKNIDTHAWDGAWYRRAWFDDGKPLGSVVDPECRIDSIAQSWAVLSGVAGEQRARLAMQAVDQQLVDREHGLVQLLAPPFDKSAMDPGYIKGYPPGIRENGGQYTHAAIWTAMAFAALGDRQRAWELLGMLKPSSHAMTAESTALYRIEPYVMASDIYSSPPHTGRGGWTWYTGASGWMYQFIVESLLGLRVRAGKLCIEPCLPAEWSGFKLHYRYRDTTYHITILQVVSAGAADSVTCDGTLQEGNAIALLDDHMEHTVEVRIRHGNS